MATKAAVKYSYGRCIQQHSPIIRGLARSSTARHGNIQLGIGATGRRGFIASSTSVALPSTASSHRRELHSLSMTSSSLAIGNNGSMTNIDPFVEQWKPVSTGYHCQSSPDSSQFSLSFSTLATDRNDDIDYSDSTVEKEEKKPQIKLLEDEDFQPEQARQQIIKAAQWNQGRADKKWDPQFCAEAISNYEAHLHYIQNKLSKSNDNKDNQNANYKILLTSNITEKAIRTVLKTKLPTQKLAKRVRSLERLIGSIGLTSLTDSLSIHLLEANSKAGNVGRALSLLNLRKTRGYKPKRREFVYAIQSIVSAGVYLRKQRNVFLNERHQPALDNPTRWLDAILVNMSGRGVQLDLDMANKMLFCYSSTGRTGKAIHYFYSLKKDQIIENEDDDGDSEANNNNQGNKTIPPEIREQMPNAEGAPNVKSKLRMKMVPTPPPYYKVPSHVKMNGNLVKRPRKDGEISKLEWEKETDWSLSLTAAFAFADSLTYGACGHEPIQLDLKSWNLLIKACCFRGAIWRALHIVQDTMPKNGIEPDVFSYNTILAGLARLGDKEFLRDILTTMMNKGITVDKYTVQALVDGYLNAGDISGAISLVQDMFNQHQTLPPYTTHLKILEFALANDLVFEAKRHVYFIQQLWKYEPVKSTATNLSDVNSFDSSMNHKTRSQYDFEKVLELTKKNPKLSKGALQRLFAYFGEELTPADFF